MGKPINEYQHVDLYWPTMVRVRPQHCNKGCDGLPRQAEILLEVSTIVVETKDGHMQINLFLIQQVRYDNYVRVCVCVCVCVFNKKGKMDFNRLFHRVTNNCKCIIIPKK